MADDSDDERRKNRVHVNQPYDESLDVADQEEVASIYAPSPNPHPGGDRGRSRGDTPPDSRMSELSDEDFDTGRPDPQLQGDDDDDDDDDDDGEEIELGQQPGHGHGMAPIPGKLPATGKPGAPMYGGDEEDEDEESGSTDDEDDDDEDGNGGAVEGAYDPADYDHLPVTPEIKELFQYITRYTPQSIELEHKLKPFIPDYIPAVGDIDAFIKVGRPDGKPDAVGLSVLDEPCAKQSDPTVLKLTLRSISKQTTLGDMVVKSVEDADRDPRAIESWIESIRDLHRSKPPPNVHYTKNMPDIDSLMQEWPEQFEELLKEVGLPTADLDCDLATYVDMICAILDIPVYKSRIQSLHVLFTLYSEFKNSQHFRVLAAENKLDNALKGGLVDNSDRLIL